MSKQPQFRVQALKYFLKGESIPWAGSTLYVSLHHDAPTWTNVQTLYELDYPGYVRQPVSPGDWAVQGQYMTNTSEIVFPNPSHYNGEVWWIGLGTHQTGDGQMLYYTNVLEEVFLIVLDEPVVIPAGGLSVRET